MERYDTRIPNNSDKKILACIPMDRYKKIGTIYERTLAFESRLLLLEIFKVKVLEILWQLTLYAMIDRPKTNNTTKINQTE
jgi:hypothetical protein